MGYLIGRVGNDIGQILPPNFVQRNAQPLLDGPVAGEDEAAARQEQHRLRQRVGEGEELLRRHGSDLYPLKYSRPCAASACVVGLRYTTTRQPASPWAMACSMATLA